MDNAWIMHANVRLQNRPVASLEGVSDSSLEARSVSCVITEDVQQSETRRAPVRNSFFAIVSQSARIVARMIKTWLAHDPVIKEISSLMLDQEFSKDLNIPPETNYLLVLAKSSLYRPLGQLSFLLRSIRIPCLPQ